MNIYDFLNLSTIIKIGSYIPGYISSEVIVEHPIELISILKDNNCYISEISWWEFSKISSGATIGYGGTRDPRNPNKYFFAETDISRKFNAKTTNKEYLDYIFQVSQQYSLIDLVPAFDIKPIDNGQSGDG